MYRIRLYCDDIATKYWDNIDFKYGSYNEALVACYEHALTEAHSLMETSDINNWYEVNTNFEITEAYENELIRGVPFFPVAIIQYDKAPWDRENDSNIKIVTGYDIVKLP